MTAQPQPMPVPLVGGVDEKADLTVVQQPVAIENARYARTGALSKRNGYRIDTSAPLPVAPYSAPEHEYVATDGDKFVARKTPTGLTFYQRRGTTESSLLGQDQREVRSATFGSAGTASRLRPELYPLPSMHAPTPHEGLVCDVALPTEFMGLQGEVYVYVRIEQVDYVPLYQADVFDIVVEYLDAVDPRLTVREASRLRRAITYQAAKETHRQIRVLQRGATFADLTILYTDDNIESGTGIWGRVLTPGATASADVWSGPVPVLSDASTTPFGGVAQFRRPRGEFDCDTFLPSSSTSRFSVVFGTQYGIGWLRIDSLVPLDGAIYDLHNPDGIIQRDVLSVAITGLENPPEQVLVVAYVAQTSGLQDCRAIRADAAATTAPTGIAWYVLANDALSGSVPPHSATAGRFKWDTGDSLADTMLAGVNCHVGFRYVYHDKIEGTFAPNINAIACAWATGRPHTIYNSRSDFLRVAMPMVSFGGVAGGGAGLLADLTPRGDYVQPNSPTNGAPLLATYAIDQIALDIKTVVSSLAVAGPPPIRTADWNAGLRMKPNHGSEFPFGPDYVSPRWLAALGVPPTATLLAVRENSTDFEFIEPGVMLVGGGVPLMLDTVHGLSELGFHASPAVLKISGYVAAAGKGYPLGTILQYRFQYRFVDGTGKAQVSPPTDPILLTATVADAMFDFTLAPIDVTLRHLGAVIIDCYGTDDRQATFYWMASLTAEGGNDLAYFADAGPAKAYRDRTQTINVENFFMTPPCATHAFKGAFRDVIVTRENELWPSKRRLSTTVPQFDIIDTAAWDATETVVTGGEIDGKLVLFSRQRIAYTYEQGGALAPFVDIPSDAGAIDGSRAFSTHLGVFYQAPAGIRVVGRDLALHETGLPVVRTLGSNIIRGGIKVPVQGEIRLRLDDGRTYLVFDYLHGSPDKPVWYVTRLNEQGPYTDENGTLHPTGLRAVADQVFSPAGKLRYLCRLGFLLEETVGRYRDEDQWVAMKARMGPSRGATPLSYLATIEAAVNLELPAGHEAAPVTLRLFADYEESVPSQAVVTQAWTIAETEAFDRRQLQITSGERVMNAPATTIEYSDENPGNVDVDTDGHGYRLSSVVMVYGPRDQKLIFPVANGARK
jgi:hypothetical protein